MWLSVNVQWGEIIKYLIYFLSQKQGGCLNSKRVPQFEYIRNQTTEESHNWKDSILFTGRNYHHNVLVIRKCFDLINIRRSFQNIQTIVYDVLYIVIGLRILKVPFDNILKHTCLLNGWQSQTIYYVVTWNVKTYVSHPLKCRMCQNWLKWCSDTSPPPTTPKLQLDLLDLENFLVKVWGGGGGGGGWSGTRPPPPPPPLNFNLTFWT